jgi:hypothetical protein
MREMGFQVNALTIFVSPTDNLCQRIDGKP